MIYLFYYKKDVTYLQSHLKHGEDNTMQEKTQTNRINDEIKPCNRPKYKKKILKWK